MGKLIYAANTSLDGFLEDETGSFDWSVPDEDVHAFWNEHERHIGTSLYGRRMYETMRVWESDDWLTNEHPVVREYAGIWRDADKVVYSTSLAEVSTARTRIERQFEPEAVATAQGDLRLGPEHRGPGDRGRGIPARPGRRVRAAAVPGHRRRRQARAASRHTTPPRATGTPTIRQRRRLPPPRGPTPRLTPAPDRGTHTRRDVSRPCESSHMRFRLDSEHRKRGDRNRRSRVSPSAASRRPRRRPARPDSRSLSGGGLEIPPGIVSAPDRCWSPAGRRLPP